MHSCVNMVRYINNDVVVMRVDQRADSGTRPLLYEVGDNVMFCIPRF